MAETLRPPKVPFNHRLHEKWDGLRTYVGNHRLGAAAAGTTLALVTIYATDLPNRVSEAMASDDSGSKKPAGAPLFPGNLPSETSSSKPNNSPTPSSGTVSNVGNVSLHCAGVEVAPSVEGKVYQITPIVDKIIGVRDSPYLYTLVTGHDFVHDQDTRHAEQGISPSFYQPGNFIGTPNVLIIDTFGTDVPPNSPDSVENLPMDFPDSQMFVCPTDALEPLAAQYGYDHSHPDPVS